jgi:hypothetical protein
MRPARIIRTDRSISTLSPVTPPRLGATITAPQGRLGGRGEQGRPVPVDMGEP